MTTVNRNRTSRRRSYWAWPGPINLYIHLIAMACWVPVLIYGRQSSFVMASATAITICVSLAWGAIRPGRGRWNQSIAWVIRTGAVAAGVWLYLATPDQPWRFVLILMYAVLYVVCEMAVWRRLRSDPNLTS